MNFTAIVSLVLSLLGKKDDIVSIVSDAIALWNKIKTALPQLEQITAAQKSNTPVDLPASVTTDYSINWLQESLNKLTNASLIVDGNYGAGTQAAVKKFQAANGLVADGWAGVQTQAAIVSALAK